MYSKIFKAWFVMCDRKLRVELWCEKHGHTELQIIHISTERLLEFWDISKYFKFKGIFEQKLDLDLNMMRNL